MAVSREEQQIVVNGGIYNARLRALMSREADKPVTARLDTDVQLTGNMTLALGSSDYAGLFGGMVFTIASHDITIELDGRTLTAIPAAPFLRSRAATP